MKLYKVRMPQTDAVKALDAVSGKPAPAKQVVAPNMSAVTDVFPSAVYIECVGEVEVLPLDKDTP